MDTTIIQIPISKQLRDQAAFAAQSQGFSSLQETVRVFLRQLASRQLRLSFVAETIELSPRAAKRYNKMLAEIDNQKTKLFTARNIDELTAHLLKPKSK